MTLIWFHKQLNLGDLTSIDAYNMILGYGIRITLFTYGW